MSATAHRFQLILTTAGSQDEAARLAHALVERRLAACVNIVENLRSVYRWKGRIEEEPERLLIVKSEKRLFSQVRETIRELHSYEVPEVLALPIDDGDPDYLSWLAASVKQED